MKIKELKIYSSNLLDQARFYSDIIELKIINKNNSAISFQIGKSILTIEQTISSTPYHFAINIPSNKENEALNWLKTRIDVLKEGEVEIHDFDFWNAKAMYFYDRDNNIVELIARKNLNINSNNEFDSSSFLGISEIGLPTIDIEREYKLLNDKTGIGIYSGSFERFCAVGDEHGLFICINKEQKDVWFPTTDKIFSSSFKAKFSEKELDYDVELNNEGLFIE